MIHICPQSCLDETLAATGARRMIALLSVGASFEKPAHLHAGDVLHLAMHDIAEERQGLIAPAKKHVESILQFARDWDRQAPLVVHCYAGISRSTAAAYAIAAALNPAGDETELAKTLRARAPSATPNIRIIRLADEILGRKGRMTRAIGAIGRGADAFEGTPFSLPLA